jgi:hypothetical protein
VARVSGTHVELCDLPSMPAIAGAAHGPAKRSPFVSHVAAGPSRYFAMPPARRMLAAWAPDAQVRRADTTVARAVSGQPGAATAVPIPSLVGLQQPRSSHVCHAERTRCGAAKEASATNTSAHDALAAPNEQQQRKRPFWDAMTGDTISPPPSLAGVAGQPHAHADHSPGSAAAGAARASARCTHGAAVRRLLLAGSRRRPALACLDVVVGIGTDGGMQHGGGVAHTESVVLDVRMQHDAWEGSTSESAAEASGVACIEHMVAAPSGTVTLFCSDGARRVLRPQSGAPRQPRAHAPPVAATLPATPGAVDDGGGAGERSAEQPGASRQLHASDSVEHHAPGLPRQAGNVRHNSAGNGALAHGAQDARSRDLSDSPKRASSDEEMLSAHSAPASDADGSSLCEQTSSMHTAHDDTASPADPPPAPLDIAQQAGTSQPRFQAEQVAGAAAQQARRAASPARSPRRPGSSAADVLPEAAQRLWISDAPDAAASRTDGAHRTAQQSAEYELSHTFQCCPRFVALKQAPMRQEAEPGAEQARPLQLLGCTEDGSTFQVDSALQAIWHPAAEAGGIVHALHACMSQHALASSASAACMVSVLPAGSCEPGSTDCSLPCLAAGPIQARAVATVTSAAILMVPCRGKDECPQWPSAQCSWSAQGDERVIAAAVAAGCVAALVAAQPGGSYLVLAAGGAAGSKAAESDDMPALTVRRYAAPAGAMALAVAQCCGGDKAVQEWLLAVTTWDGTVCVYSASRAVSSSSSSSGASKLSLLCEHRYGAQALAAAAVSTGTTEGTGVQAESLAIWSPQQTPPTRAGAGGGVRAVALVGTRCGVLLAFAVRNRAQRMNGAEHFVTLEACVCLGTQPVQVAVAPTLASAAMTAFVACHGLSAVKVRIDSADGSIMVHRHAVAVPQHVAQCIDALVALPATPSSACNAPPGGGDTGTDCHLLVTSGAARGSSALHQVQLPGSALACGSQTLLRLTPLHAVDAAGATRSVPAEAASQPQRPRRPAWARMLPSSIARRAERHIWDANGAAAAAAASAPRQLDPPRPTLPAFASLHVSGLEHTLVVLPPSTGRGPLGMPCATLSVLPAAQDTLAGVAAGAPVLRTLWTTQPQQSITAVSQWQPFGASGTDRCASSAASAIIHKHGFGIASMFSDRGSLRCTAQLQPFVPHLQVR